MADASANQRFADNLRNVGKYLYWIIGGLLIVGISYIFYNRLQKPISGVLFFMAGVLALYFYYVKWFVAPEKRPSWPPYQTPCPDYLTMMDSGLVGAAPGSYKCMDFVGVSRNGRLKKADPRRIKEQENNPDYVFMVNKGEEKEQLRQRVLAYGLTWNSLFGDN
jgi:hypothetical protein